MLCFGVVRPYKGVDVLVDAFRSVEGAELWVVGRPLGVSTTALDAPPNVRFVPRYVSDAELPAYFRRADLLVLPTAPWTCRACCSPASPSASRWCSPTWAASARWSRSTAPGDWSPPGDPGALSDAIGELLADPAERERLAERARAAAAGPYSWDSVAQRTLAVYEEVLAR